MKTRAEIKKEIQKERQRLSSCQWQHFRRDPFYKFKADYEGRRKK